MAEPFLSEIRIVSFNFPPKGWAFCNGQLLPINQNQALFSLLGTTYGGDGRTTFALPNLQGRMPVHFGQGLVLGETGGEASVTLTTAQLPAHTHLAQGVSTKAAAPSPAGNAWATSTSNPYSNASNTTMESSNVTSQGGGQAHNNMPPYLALNFVIALQGIFPSQN